MSTRLSDASFALETRHETGGALTFAGFVIVVLGLGLGLTVHPSLAILAAIPPALLMITWVWREPVRGLHLLLAATLLFEIFPLRFPDSLTDRVPFFLNLNNTNSSAGLTGFPITPAEILMVAVLGIWFAVGVAKRTLALSRGPIMTAYLIFTVVVMAAEIHGILGRGKWDRSLWELRPQVYGLVAFFMAANMVQTRKHLKHLVIIFFVVVTFKVGVALYRYFVTLHGNDTAYEAIMAHEESYFYALLIFAAGAALVWGQSLSRGLKLTLLGGAGLGAFALVVNHRRAAELSLIAGIGTIMFLAIRFDEARRGRWLALSLLTVFFATAFTVGYWDHTNGLTGQLIRPIRSMFMPDPRDYLSNIYRVAEDGNIWLTFRSSPLIGIGFGIPMFVVYPMADISSSYPLWNYIPHNTLLWIGMRMGAVGYAAFWGLVAMAVLQACRELAGRRDPLSSSFAAFAVAAIVGEILQGYSDLQLDSYRNLIVFGALLGMLHALPKLADA